MSGTVTSAIVIIRDVRKRLTGLDTDHLTPADGETFDAMLELLKATEGLLETTENAAADGLELDRGKVVAALEEQRRVRPLGYNGPPDDTSVVEALDMPVGTHIDDALAKIRELREFRQNIDTIVGELCHSFRINPAERFSENLSHLRRTATIWMGTHDWLVKLVEDMGLEVEDHHEASLRQAISRWIDSIGMVQEFSTRVREALPLVGKEQLRPAELDRRIIEALQFSGYVLPFLKTIVRDHFPEKFKARRIFDDEVASWIRNAVEARAALDGFLNEIYQLGHRNLADVMKALTEPTPLRMVFTDTNRDESTETGEQWPELRLDREVLEDVHGTVIANFSGDSAYWELSGDPIPYDQVRILPANHPDARSDLMCYDGDGLADHDRAGDANDDEEETG